LKDIPCFEQATSFLPLQSNFCESTLVTALVLVLYTFYITFSDLNKKKGKP